MSNPWPLDVPRPDPAVLEQIACCITIAKITAPYHDARRVAEEIFPGVYRLVRDAERTRKTTVGP